MKCPKCGFEQPGGTECLRCGIVFEKYLKRQMAPSEEKDGGLQDVPAVESGSETEEETEGLRELLFYVNPEAGMVSLIGRALFLLVLFFWGLKLVFSSVAGNYAGQSFLHMVNLPFHEAGHILFRPFGRFIMTLGGSLNQLLIPLICLLVFLFKTRDPFGAAVSLWWFGENFIDLAPYINDARDLKLMLLGGVTGRDAPGFHDWQYILGKLGLLQYDHFLAGTSHLTGALLMTCAVAWGGLLCLKQFRNRDAGFSF
jgi:hypothetical protein